MSDTVGALLLLGILLLLGTIIGNAIYNKIDAVNKKQSKKYTKSEWYKSEGGRGGDINDIS